MDNIKKIARTRERRRSRAKKKIWGNQERPRLVVYRSLRHIYAQLVNDDEHRSLIAVSSLSSQVAEKVKGIKGKVDVSRAVGEALAVNAKDKGVQRVVFDRRGYKYHGRVKALAEGARQGGLEF